MDNGTSPIVNIEPILKAVKHFKVFPTEANKKYLLKLVTNLRTER